MCKFAIGESQLKFANRKYHPLASFNKQFGQAPKDQIHVLQTIFEQYFHVKTHNLIRNLKLIISFRHFGKAERPPRFQNRIYL